MAEAGHVEHEPFFQLEPPARGDRLAERKEVDEPSGAVLNPMRRARTSEAKVRQSVLECLEIGEALNNDGHVNFEDLSFLLLKWGSDDEEADLNHDGKVNIYDLSKLLTNYGS